MDYFADPKTSIGYAYVTARWELTSPKLSSGRCEARVILIAAGVSPNYALAHFRSFSPGTLSTGM